MINKLKKQYKNEKFVYINNYNIKYVISNYGRIYTFKKNKFMNWQFNDRGYAQIQLYKNAIPKTFRISRLVIEYFSYKKSMEVNHKDGDKRNNYIDNLEYMTHADNMIHAKDMGLLGIKIKQINKIDRKIINKFNSISEASRKTGICICNIGAVVSKKRKTAGGYLWEKI